MAPSTFSRRGPQPRKSPARSSDHLETEAILQEVIALFQKKDDVTQVRESGRAISELQAAADAKHREMLESSEASDSSGEDEAAGDGDVESRAESVMNQLDPEVSSEYQIDANFVSRVRHYVDTWDTWAQAA